MRLLPLPRRRRRQFERAADGSMSLMEHLRELRDRLFKACLAILAGMVIGWLLSERVLNLLEGPYCEYAAGVEAKKRGTLPADWSCQFLLLHPADPLLLKMKITMWTGLVVAAPLWLYQLWAFVAPGLHRHERRWAYAFAAIAAPLFALGAVLAYWVVAKGLEFLLQFAGENVETQLELIRYVDFVTGLMLLFGVAFEFPLAALLLNVAGVLSARKLLGWWRSVVFAFFAFAAVATPTPDPFGMTALALALSGLYFGAVGLAFLNDRRRRRKDPEHFADLDDDAVSPLEYDRSTVQQLDPVAPAAPIEPPEPVGASPSISASGSAPRADPVLGAMPLARHYDDMT